MAEVRLEGVSKTYPDGTRAVKEISLVIPDGAFCVLVGPSGCGKTTLLRMVAGLEEITGGEVRIGGTLVNDVPAKARDVAMVFQNYALYPHMTVYDNIAFSLKMRRESRRTIDEKVRATASVLGLDAYLDRQPRLLSGGQRQRVAMGRAIVREPQVMLMDEPLSNLDAKLRVQMRTEIGRRQRDLGVTTMYVTHDQTEAMTLGDRVAVFRQGVIEQVATPVELFENPANVFVASFIGSPAMNLLAGTVERHADGLRLILGSRAWDLPAAITTTWPQLEAYIGRAVVVGIRPEDVDTVRGSGEHPTTLTGRVDVREVMGRVAHLHTLIDAAPAVTDATLEVQADVEGVQDIQDLILPAQAARDEATFIAIVDAQDRVGIGQDVEIGVDLTKLYFFDAESGAGLRYL